MGVVTSTTLCWWRSPLAHFEDMLYIGFFLSRHNPTGSGNLNLNIFPKNNILNRIFLSLLDEPSTSKNLFFIIVTQKSNLSTYLRMSLVNNPTCVLYLKLGLKNKYLHITLWRDLQKTWNLDL